MTKAFKILGVILLLMVLAALRFWQKELFYDPLAVFFNGNYLGEETLPELEFWKLLGASAVRYWINSIISIGIIGLLFRASGIIKISLMIYAGAFVVLLFIFAYLLMNYTSDYQLALFYVRRFLIQPLLLLILLPAFYYHRIQSKK